MCRSQWKVWYLHSKYYLRHNGRIWHRLFWLQRSRAWQYGSNMSREFDGPQSNILRQNNLCIFSPCACHSLRLIGKDCTAIFKDAVTFFLTVQTISALERQNTFLFKITCSEIHAILCFIWFNYKRKVRIINWWYFL